MGNSQITAAKLAAVFVVLAATFFASQSVLAQVEVVESNPIIRPLGQRPGVTSPVNGQGAGPTNPLDDLFQQIQALQQQVQLQTGLIEELNFELKRLKQQRMDDYIDLDRRLSELTQSEVNRPGNVRTNPAAGSSVSPSANRGSRNSTAAADTAGATSASRASASDETAVYRAANDLISAREWDKAIAAMLTYLDDFPAGRYESNAHYWLGELYFVKNDMANARDSFQLVIDQFPTSDKVHASKYKLGRTYFQMGDKATAKRILEEEASTNSDSSRQAATFLRDNF